jgi:hypothetical protein
MFPDDENKIVVAFVGGVAYFPKGLGHTGFEIERAQPLAYPLWRIRVFHMKDYRYIRVEDPEVMVALLKLPRWHL